MVSKFNFWWFTIRDAIYMFFGFTSISCLLAITMAWGECEATMKRIEQSEAAFADRFQNQELRKLNKNLARLIYSYTTPESEKDGH